MQRISDHAVAVAPLEHSPHPQTTTRDRRILWTILAVSLAVVAHAWATTRPTLVCDHNCGNSTIEVGEIRIDIV